MLAHLVSFADEDARPSNIWQISVNIIQKMKQYNFVSRSKHQTKVYIYEAKLNSVMTKPEIDA